MGNKNEEQLLTELHEMQNLMDYMNSGIIKENTSNADIKRTARTQAKNPNTGGLSNAREREVVGALQQLIDKFKADGNQYNAKVKIYVEKLWAAVNDSEANNQQVTEEVIDEGLAAEITSEYNIEALIQKIAKEKNQHPSTIAIMLSKIADGINAKKNRPS